MVDTIQLPQLQPPRLAASSPSQGGEALALWNHLPFPGLAGTDAAVERVPVEVPAVEVVRVWGVAEGRDALLPLQSARCEAVVFPGQAGKEDWSGSDSHRVVEFTRVTDFRSWDRQLETCVLVIPKPPFAEKQLSPGVEGMVSLSPTMPATDLIFSCT